MKLITPDSETSRYHLQTLMELARAGTGGFDLQRGCRVTQFHREFIGTKTDVDSQPEHDVATIRILNALQEDPANFTAAHQDVIRPLDSSRNG